MFSFSLVSSPQLYIFPLASSISQPPSPSFSQPAGPITLSFLVCSCMSLDSCLSCDGHTIIPSGSSTVSGQINLRQDTVRPGSRRIPPLQSMKSSVSMAYSDVVVTQSLISSVDWPCGHKVILC